MNLPIYRVLPHPTARNEDGTHRWCFTKSQGWRWPSVIRRIQHTYPTWARAMDAAFEKPDVVTHRQVVWIWEQK
jgi:hypothetical protein